MTPRWNFPRRIDTRAKRGKNMRREEKTQKREMFEVALKGRRTEPEKGEEDGIFQRTA